MRIYILLLLLPIFTLASELESSFQNILGKNDLIYIGEVHGSGLNASVLSRILHTSLTSGQKINFATESILHSGDKLLQTFLNESDDEKAKKILNEMQLHQVSNFRGWLINNSFIELFWELRNLKQKHKDNFNVCAVDFRHDTLPFFGDTKTITKRRKIKQAYLTTKSISVLESRGLKIEDYINKPKSKHFHLELFREMTMAQATYDCANNSGKTIAHIGASHSISQKKTSGQTSIMSDLVLELTKDKNPKLKTTNIHIISALENKKSATEAAYCINCKIEPYYSALYKINLEESIIISSKQVRNMYKRNSSILNNPLNNKLRRLNRQAYDYFILTPNTEKLEDNEQIVNELMKELKEREEKKTKS